MNEPTIGRRTLDGIAAELRAMAAAAKNSAANHDLNGNDADAEFWGGLATGLMDAHGLVAAVLTVGQPLGSDAAESERVFPIPAGGAEATAYRTGDRVTVTYKSGIGTWVGTVIHTFPAGDRMVYVVRPDGADPSHRGHMVEAEQMAPAGQERVS